MHEIKTCYRRRTRNSTLRLASGQPPTTKTTGTLTAKDEILGLGDDLRTPKQIQDAPTVSKVDET